MEDLGRWVGFSKGVEKSNRVQLSKGKKAHNEHGFFLAPNLAPAEFHLGDTTFYWIKFYSLLL